MRFRIWLKSRLLCTLGFQVRRVLQAAEQRRQAQPATCRALGNACVAAFCDDCFAWVAAQQCATQGCTTEPRGGGAAAAHLLPPLSLIWLPDSTFRPAYSPLLALLHTARVRLPRPSGMASEAVRGVKEGRLRIRCL